MPDADVITTLMNLGVPGFLLLSAGFGGYRSYSNHVKEISIPESKARIKFMSNLSDSISKLTTAVDGNTEMLSKILEHNTLTKDHIDKLSDTIERHTSAISVKRDK